MNSLKTAHTLRSLFNQLTQLKLTGRQNASLSGRRRSGALALTLVLVAMAFVLLPGYYVVKANASPSMANSFSESYLSLTHGMQNLMHKLFGAAPDAVTSAPAACNLTQLVTQTGCYYTGSSKFTVSVEVGWTGAVNGDTITVSLDGGAQTRIIKPEARYDPGSGGPNAGPLVSPQVVAFEITADGAPHTVMSTLSGSSACIIGPSIITPVTACAPILCTAGELGGTAYFDFNGDGVRQAGELLGVMGVTIKAYDSSNALVATATSDSEGRYKFSGANAIVAGAYPVRLEFTNLPTSGFNTTTRIGANNGSSVQFVNAAQCNVDVSVLDESLYCQDNPLIVLPCYVNGDPLPNPGTSGDGAALLAYPYNSTGQPMPPLKKMLATSRQVGTLWGVAYDKYTNKTFSSAILRRHVGLGPLGLGGIYVTNMTTSATANFVDVTTLGVDVGQASVPSNAARGLVADKLQPSHDTVIFPLVGKVGIGDLDISEDGNKLWFVNMNDKKLYSIDITAYNASNTLPTAANIASTPIPPVQPCVTGASRPFGTAFYRGKVYVGSVCDGFGGTRSDLRANVFAYDPAANSWSTALDFPLTYPKGYPLNQISAVTGWFPWTNNFNNLVVLGRGLVHPEPLLADIVFDTDGTMVLGFADRASLQAGYDNYGPNAGDGTLYRGFSGGDVLRAFFSNGSFVLENNAKAGPYTGYGPGNNQGPGFGEFYNDNFTDEINTAHSEMFVGGLALKPGSGELVAVTMDPLPSQFDGAGVRTLSNFTGRTTRAFLVYTSSSNTGDGLFGKAAGLGDLELTCGTVSFLELGNRVWMDTNANGIQDPNEMPIQGVTVHLYQQGNTTAVATAVTDANGNYRFTSVDANNDGVLDTDANLADSVGLVDGAGLLPNTNYLIRLDRAADYQVGGVLFGKSASVADAGSGTYGSVADLRDSDGVIGNVYNLPGGPFSEIVVQHVVGGTAVNGTGMYGEVDHTFDFGFFSVPLLNLGNLVWKDNNNNGLKDANEPGMNGVTVQIYRDTNGNNQLDLATDQLVSTVITSGTGANAGQYSFTNLVPGNYFVYLPSSNFTGAGALAGCISSTIDAPNPNNDVDNDDNGLPGPNGGVVTGVIILTDHGEPTNDGDGDNGNLTVDLGFYSPMNLGNLVWKDENNDGIHQPAEAGIDGVLVELFRDANNNGTFEEVGDTPVGTLTTAGGGLYNFTNLLPGVYFVRVAKTNFQPGGVLAGFLSSSITATNPDNDLDNDDNGLDTPPSAVGILSNGVTLIGNSEPTNDGDGANGNLTLDFGFYSLLTLGNQVWKDNNNNGLKDAGEPGIDNVTVELIRDANNNNLPDDAVVTTVNTTGGGLYQFTNVQPGNYFVRIAAINFQGTNTLAGCFSSTTTNANPNSDIDNDDNGIDNPNPQTNGIVSGVITLASNTEPPANVDGDGTSANETVDFGFYAPMNVGNLVWKDFNNNGLRDAGEPGVDGVVIELFRDTNNNGTFEPGTDLSAGTTTTAGGGLYSFANLLPGNYFLRVAPINFQSGGALFGSSSSSVSNPTPNSDIDNDDNGIDNPSPQTNGILSGLVTLAGNSEPPVAVDGDGTNGNLTVDFGFITGALSIGNMIWKDTNSNGLHEASEPGIANVTVELIRDANGNGLPDDAVVQTVTTNPQGVYNFTSLAPGNYFVRVAVSNFVPGGALYGCVSSLGTNPPNNDVDNDDNGSDSNNPAAAPPISGIITLTEGGEPTNDGDGADSNQTVDFGFISPIAVTITGPATCIGPGTVLQIEAVVINSGGATQQNNPGAEIEINLPPTLAAVAGSCTSQGGNGTCAITGTQRVTWDGSYTPGERVVLRYRVQIASTAIPGQQFCITTLANYDADNNGSNESQQSATACGTVSCLPLGPGVVIPAGCSVLIYPVYTSSSTNPNAGNTRINLTNINPNTSTAVHLFFVDGATCSVSDARVCLTANQTTSFLASDLDPGVTGYIIAVAVDPNGCPSNFNFLLGDEYVKFESGHFGNLAADCAKAIPGGLPACQVTSSTATLNFDGASYSQLPQTVAVDNLPDRASGNDTMLILDRISGNLATGMDKLGGILGLLYNDTETAYSFSFTPNTCQFRSSLSNNFPRTAPRYETVIPAGRSGWMKLSSVGTAMTGATFNRNTNSVGSANAFNGAHGVHAITLNPSVSVTMPVFPPSCL